MPDWTRVLEASTLFHCPPWEIEERDDGYFWQEHALTYEHIKAEVQQAQSKHGKK